METFPVVDVSKKYTPLASIPKQEIGRCSYMLPNRCQCWRAADYLIQESTTISGTADTEAFVKQSSYQFCARHAIIQQAVDAGRMEPENAHQEAQADVLAQNKDNMQHNPTGPKIPVGSSGQTAASTEEVTKKNVIGGQASTAQTQGGNEKSKEEKPPVTIPADVAKNPPPATQPTTASPAKPTSPVAGTNSQTQVQTPAAATSTTPPSTPAPKTT